MGGGGADGLSAVGDRGAAVSLTPDAGGTHAYIFKSSQLEGLHIGDLLYVINTKKGLVEKQLFERGFQF